jgi:hypothetical protein
MYLKKKSKLKKIIIFCVCVQFPKAQQGDGSTFKKKKWKTSARVWVIANIFVVFYPKSLSGLLAVLGGRIQVEAKRLEWE